MTPRKRCCQLIEHREIFRDEMLSLMRQIMGGEVTPVQIAALITGLRVKKETIGEIAAAAEVMRELATKVPVAGPHASGRHLRHRRRLARTPSTSPPPRRSSRPRRRARGQARRPFGVVASRAAPTCWKRSA
jgi:hypothetical protein